MLKHLTHFLIRTLLALLVVAFGTVAGFSAQGDWSQFSYPVVANELSGPPVNLTNTARAPPTGVENVAFTGNSFAGRRDVRAKDISSKDMLRTW